MQFELFYCEILVVADQLVCDAVKKEGIGTDN